jgi:hypothetical protein
MGIFPHFRLTLTFFALFAGPVPKVDLRMLNFTPRRFALLTVLSVLAFQTVEARGASNAVTVVAASAANATFAQTSVGQASSVQVVQLQLGSALALSSVGVQQSTGTKQEFMVGAITGCTVDGSTVNAAGSICSVPVTFTPAYPGLRQLPLVVVDSTGATYSFGLTGIGNGPQTVLLPGTVATISGLAGTTASTALGDGGAASAAAIYAPEGIVVDNSSNIYIADTSHNRIRVIYAAGAALACLIEVENPTSFGLAAGATSCAGATSAPVANDIYTVAGNGTAAYSNDGALATTAELNAPASVAVDASGNVYIGDVTNFRVRVIYVGGAQAACLIEMENGASFGLGATPASCAGATSAPVAGYIYTVAGTGVAGFTGDAGLASAAKIAAPYGVALDSAGDLFFAADSSTAGIGGHIRVIYEGGANAANLIGLENASEVPVVGNIYTVMGGATSLTSAGDGGLATNGAMLYAYGLTVDLNGNVYFPDKTSGTAPTVAKVRVVYNSGAALGTLIGIENNGITAIPGFVYSIAGTSAVGSGPDNVLATASALSGSYDVAVDPGGNVYLAERLNETIRKINAQTGIITTIAGVAGSQGVVSGTATTVARLWGPWSVALDSFGGIYFTDNGANRLRNDSAAAGTVTFASTAVGATSANQYVSVNNIGTSNLTISGVTASTDFGITPAGTEIGDCAAGAVLAAGASCAVPVSFSPQTGGVITGTATVTDNGLNLTAANHTAPLSGTGAGTTTTLVANPATPIYGQSVTLTATVVDSTSTPVTSGTVTFSVGGTTLGSAAISAGAASITTTLLPGGAITVNTAYPANGPYSESNASFPLTVTPAAVTITVNPATKVYGAALPVFSGTNGATQNGDMLSIKYSTTATAASSVGSYTINAALTGVSATNYTATVTTALLTVTPATLTAAANNLSRPVNSANPPLTYGVTGYVNGDTSSILSGVPGLSTTAVMSSIVGNYPITITQGTLAANSNYTFALVNGVLQVTFLGSQTITFAPIANVVYGAAPFTVNATSSSGLPVTISVVSGGNVALSGNTSTLVNGTVTVTGAGAVTLQANQAGNGSYPAATAVNQSFTVNAAPLAVKATNVSYTYGAPTALTGSVTGTVSPDSFTETFSTNAGSTTPVPAGSYTITPAVTANGSTNVANYAITYTNGTLTVNKAVTTTTLTSSTSNANLGVSILFTATVASATTGTPTGTVTLTSGGTVLGTATLNGSGVATFSVSTLAAGTSGIVATYSGDANFNGSANPALTQIVTAPAFAVTSSVAGIAIKQGQTGSVTLTVSSVGGYAKTLTPACGSGLPAGVTCSFNPSTLVFTGTNATQTMVVTISAVNTTASIRNVGTALFAMLWLPVGLLGLRRKGSWQRLAMVALVLFGGLVAMGGLTGCGSTSRDADLGTFSVPITLTDGATTSTTALTVTIVGTSSVN